MLAVRLLTTTACLGALLGASGCGGDTLQGLDPSSRLGDPNDPEGSEWEPGLPPPSASETPPANTCQTGGLLGRLCVPGRDEAMVGAHVYIYAANCNGEVGLYRTESLSNGQFSLAGLPAGNHDLIVEHGETRKQIAVRVIAGEIVIVDTVDPGAPICQDAGQPRIAVIGGEFDEVERLLTGMELAYDHYSSLPLTGPSLHSEAYDLLSNFEELSAYDAVYFNCGSLDRDFLFATVVDTQTAQSVTFNFQAATYENLRKFVLHGGNIYASDWSWPIAKALNNGVLDFYGDESNALAPLVGIDEATSASIPDAELGAFVGANSVPVDYDLEGWAVLDRIGPQAKVHVVGDVDAMINGQSQRLTGKPLLVSFRPLTGGGLIVFTTFHYHAQPQHQMLDVLRYLIFQL